MFNIENYAVSWGNNFCNEKLSVLFFSWINGCFLSLYTSYENTKVLKCFTDFNIWLIWKKTFYLKQLLNMFFSSKILKIKSFKNSFFIQ